MNSITYSANGPPSTPESSRSQGSERPMLSKVHASEQPSTMKYFVRTLR